jgi:hypothetical protein
MGALMAWRSAPARRGPLPAVDVRQPQAAAEHGFHVALLVRLDARVVHVALHARKALEVALDVVLGRFLLDAQVARQAEGAHAVDQPEVDDLGVAALLR